MPPSTNSGLAGALFHLHPAFGVDIHDRECVAIQDCFQLFDRCRLVRIADRAINSLVIGGGEWLSQITQRIFQAAHLLGQRLQGDRGFPLVVMFGLLRRGNPDCREQN